MNYLNVGDKVLVFVPPEDRAVHAIAARYNEQKMAVSRRVPVGRHRVPYYELKGAESEFGVPYGFVKDWLVEL